MSRVAYYNMCVCKYIRLTETIKHTGNLEIMPSIKNALMNSVTSCLQCAIQIDTSQY